MFQKEKWTAGRSSQVSLLTVVLSYAALAATHFSITRHLDLPLLFGDKREAMFDLWTLQHVCAGILIGSTLLFWSKSCRSRMWTDFALPVVQFTLFWEALEFFMELGVFGQAVAEWKAGFEHWSNRLLGDLMMVVTGALLARRYSNAWKVVLVPATVWLLFNVLSPNSMYIQHLLFG